jgi:3-hydroxy acid dehydrogenase / malonic semialdehyde reductase
MEKVVFITGATAGFGRATAIKFAANGYNLIITGRRSEKLIALKAALENEYKISVLTLCFDVQQNEQVKEAMQQVANTFKHIDILINNAGLALGRDLFDESDVADWDIMIDTNVKGLLYVTKAVLPLLFYSAAPHIINMGSIAGKEVYQKGSVYCASKFAVDAITKALRIDLLSRKIKVTAIHPGAAETEFSLVRFKGEQQKAKDMYEGYQPLSDVDIADIIFFTATLPPHVCINELTVTPLAQANSFHLHKSD